MNNPDQPPASAGSPPPAEMTAILHRLLVRNGTMLLDDRARLLSLLTEQAPSEGRAVRLLMSAYDLDVPQHLLDDNGTPSALKVEHDVNALVSETGLQADLARWAVLAWSTALGMSLPDSAAPSPSVAAAIPAAATVPAALADDLTWGDDLPVTAQPSPVPVAAFASPTAMPAAPAYPQPIPTSPFFKSPLGIMAIVVVLLAIAFLIANYFFHWEMLELWDDFYFAFLYDLFN